MFDTQYNRNIAAQIARLQRQHINNIDMLHDESNGPLMGGKMTAKKFFNNLGHSISHAVAPIGKSILKDTGQAIGQSFGEGASDFLGQPELAPIAGQIGSDLGNQAGSALGNALFGKGIHRHLKDTPSKTHPHDLDYTTKYGNLDHHIGGHDVKEAEMPYTMYGGRINHHKKTSHTKGTKSKTHKGELDYTTKKGDKVHHIGGHDIYSMGEPYSVYGGAMVASQNLADAIPAMRGGKIHHHKHHHHSRDHEILGLHGGATKEEIKKAYKKIAKKIHPHINHHDPHALEKFHHLHAAFERLSGGKMRRYAPRKRKHTL